LGLKSPSVLFLSVTAVVTVGRLVLNMDRNDNVLVDLVAEAELHASLGLSTHLMAVLTEAIAGSRAAKGLADLERVRHLDVKRVLALINFVLELSRKINLASLTVGDMHGLVTLLRASSSLGLRLANARASQMRGGRLSSLALLLVVVPHATKKTGRFVLKELMIYPITEFVDLIKSIDPRSREIFELHKTMREEFQRENDGQYDYATMAVMAKNEGPGRIPGDMPLIFRFKPIAISWPIINESPIFANPAVDWSAILKMQIERDLRC